MELKQHRTFHEATARKSSNRTFMELKLTDNAGEHGRHHRSNRTFMELKQP